MFVGYLNKISFSEKDVWKLLNYVTILTVSIVIRFIKQVTSQS